jgi:hypothetical protein
MNRTELIRLANVAGLDVENPQHVVALTDAFLTVGEENVPAFVDFVRRRKEGVEYQNRVERLDTLANAYVREAEEAKVRDRAASFAYRLTEKVRSIRVSYINARAEGKNLDFSSFRKAGTSEPYFADKEVRALEAVAGGLSGAITLFEIGKLEDALSGKYIQRATEAARISSKGGPGSPTPTPGAGNAQNRRSVDSLISKAATAARKD